LFNFDWSKRTHKGLRRWVMYIVREGPRSGAEIMDVMEGSLQGWWRPSPGSVYPLLKKMVDEGILSRSSEDKYVLTEMGREELDHPFPWLGGNAPSPRSVEGVLEEMSSNVSYLEDLARSKDKRLAEKAVEVRELSDRLVKVAAS
jgi:DNA-binding PadR family transcriptional regulator